MVRKFENFMFFVGLSLGYYVIAGLAYSIVV